MRFSKEIYIGLVRPFFAILILCVLIISCGEKQKNKVIENGFEINKIDSLNSEAEHFLDIKNFKDAFTNLNVGLGLSKKYNYKYGLMSLNLTLCKYYIATNKKDSASYFGEKALTYFDSKNATERELKLATLVMVNLSILYVETGNYGITFRYIFESLKISKNLTDPKFLCNYYGKLAYIFYTLNQFEEAQSYYFKRLGILKSFDDNFQNKMDKQGVYRDLALTYYNLKNYSISVNYYDSAITCLQNVNAIDSASQKKVDIAFGVVYGNKGQCLFSLKKYNEAITELNKNIQINNRIGYDVIDATSSLIALANLYLETGNTSKFNPTMKTTDSLYEARKTNVYFVRLLKIKALSYEKINNKAEGYNLLKKFLAWNDSTNSSLMKFNLRYKLGLIDIEKSNEKIEELNTETNESKSLFYRSLAVAALLIILLFVSIRNASKSRKNEKKLKTLNIQNQRNQIALEQSNLDMQKLVIEKNNILGIVAHDLKSPVSSIKGLSSLLESDLQEQDVMNETFAQYFNYINASVNHMNAVTDDLLEISSLENLGYKIEMKNTNINQLVNETILVFDHKAKQKFITIKTELEADIWHVINKQKIERALGNLINNAIKFSQHGSEIIVTAIKENDNLIFKITDFGIGIDASNIEKIFDRFTKAKNIGTSGEKPVGLGLSIVKQIVEKHSGTIAVQSKKSVSTTFTISLPPANSA